MVVFGMYPFCAHALNLHGGKSMTVLKEFFKTFDVLIF